MSRISRALAAAPFVLLALVAGCSKKDVVRPKRDVPPAFSSWMPLPGPSTVVVRALAGRSPFTVIAGTDDGIWRSVDNGGSWVRADGVVVNALTIDAGGVLYGGTAGAGVVRSTDGGATWEDFSAGLAANANVISIASTPTGIFAGLAGGGGVVAFATGDDHWADASSGLPASSTVNALAYDPGLSLTAGTAAGRTWTFSSGNWVAGALSTGNPVLSVEPIESGHVLAGVQNQGVFLDGTNAGLPGVPSVYSLLRFSGKDYAGTNLDVFVTANGGVNWTQVTSDLPDGTPLTSLAATPGALFAGSAGRGVFRTTDGTNWASSGPPEARVNALSQRANGRLFAGTSLGIVYSDDSGDHWHSTDRTDGAIACLAEQGSTLFAGTLGNGVVRSNTGGLTWTAASNGLPAGAGVFRLATDGTTLFANLVADPVGLYRSTDGGDSWTPVTTLAHHENVTDLAVLAGRVYASEFGATGGVFVSNDHGATWAPSNGAFLGGKTVTALGAGGIAVYAATTDGFFFSEDNGTSWHPTFWPGLIAKQIAVHGEDVAVVWTNGTVQRTKDAGEHWDEETPPGQVLSVGAGASAFFLGTDTRTWKADY